jgi:SAM-dependent methyltransferase
MASNEGQRAFWNREDFAAAWPKRERLTTAVTPHLVAALALKRGERVVEVGSGGGLAAIAAARAVGPGGEVLGLDLSAPLTRMAAARAAEAGVTNVRFAVGDAQEDAIPGAPYDAAMSQFGVMFFADPVAAFRNVRVHLKPGGRLAFACWQPGSANAWFPGGVLSRFVDAPAALPPPSATPPPGPFAFGDPEYVRGILGGAGFRDIGHTPLEIEVGVPDETLYDDATIRTTAGVPPEREAEAWEALRGWATNMRGADGDLHLVLAVHIFAAHNPG